MDNKAIEIVRSYMEETEKAGIAYSYIGGT